MLRHFKDDPCPDFVRWRGLQWKASSLPRIGAVIQPADIREMKTTRSLYVSSLCVSFVVCFAGQMDLRCSAADMSFSQDVRPILAEYCLHCHGPDEQVREAGLRLDIADTGVPSAIVAGHPDASEIIARLTSTDPDERMPPPEMDKRPSSDEIEVLRRWIAEGAAFESHWAYQPIRKPNVPSPSEPASTDIDRFIISALSEKGLTLSPTLNRRQLIRRASFDLIGLPPTPEGVDAFVEDSSPDAFAKVIDRLLESPRYGERWGRHWLDIARYADTHGGTAIGYVRFPFSYTYRDYVIRAFNDNLSYDQFVIQQLAADQLDLDDNDPALAASGFLTVGMQFRSIHDLIDDQIDVVTRGLMGMTVACARCHDHKFDAIPTSDYYSLYATFASSQQPDDLPVLGDPKPTAELEQYQKQLQDRQTVQRDMARDQAEVMRSRLRNQVGLFLSELAKGTPEQDVSAEILSYRTDDVRPLALNRWREYLRQLHDDDPVFGPWLKLDEVPADQFADQCERLIQTMKTDNGDPKKFAETHQLSLEGPKWNPRVLETIETSKPKSQIELAQAYGKLFAEVNQGWLRGLLESSREAVPGGEILTDEDPRHAEVNSTINQQIRRHLYEPGTPIAMPDEIAVKMLNRTVADTLSGKRNTIHDLHLNSPGSPPRGMVLRESKYPPTFHVLQRGNPLSRGETVTAHFLTALSDDTARPFDDGKRRLGLALAVVSPENPLTARVAVNWIWRNHFGLGLVRTPDDLGTRGTPPTHPELLDHLASEFVADGWSIKQMHRRIMLSDVYQQSAIENGLARQADPNNELLWRMPRKRLELEAMRDAMLAVSGELDTTVIGGRPFDFESAPIVPRRSVYGFINRDIISNIASTFDGADPTSCTVERPTTIVPQQTLYALNSGFIQDRAASVAALATNAAADDAGRVRWLYDRLFSRPPDQDEVRSAVEFVSRTNDDETSDAETQEELTETTANRWAQLAHAMLASNEFVFVD